MRIILAPITRAIIPLMHKLLIFLTHQQHFGELGYWERERQFRRDFDWIRLLLFVKHNAKSVSRFILCSSKALFICTLVEMTVTLR